MIASAVVLDAGPLGLVSNPRPTPDCSLWLEKLLERGCRVIIPGISDYEVRRELIRANKLRGLRRLAQLCQDSEFLPVTQEALWRAAELWALLRRQGRPTAGPGALDADVILAAQVLLLQEPDVVVATANVGHLARLAPAARWQDII